MAYMWLIVIFVLTLIELLTINLVTIWFVASAIVSIILSFITDSILIQFGAFVIIGIVLMIITRPLIKKTINKTGTKTNLDRIIGMNGVVIDEIEKNGLGSVKVDGKIWSAISDINITKGCIVDILEIDGVKLKVKQIEEEK